MSKYITYDQNDVIPYFGLESNGTMCWCNSILQILFGLPSLNKVLIECEHELKNNIFATTYIAYAKCALNITNCNINLNRVSTDILNAYMTQRPDKRLDRFGLNQECVDEALTAFIDAFDCEHVENLFTNIYEYTWVCTQCDKSTTSRDKSFRIELFTQCMLTTDNMFRDWIKVHPSDCDYYKCDCGFINLHIKRREDLRMLREIVVVIFNKFQYKENKHFPQTMMFPTTGGFLKYKLVGKIEHSGGQHGGHYWAHSLRDDAWYKFNDINVSTGNPMPTTETFLLAYHMID